MRRARLSRGALERQRRAYEAALRGESAGHTAEAPLPGRPCAGSLRVIEGGRARPTVPEEACQSPDDLPPAA